MARLLAALFTFTIFVLPSVFAHAQAPHMHHSLALSALVVVPNIFAPAVSAYVVTVPPGHKRNTLQDRKNHKHNSAAQTGAGANSTVAAANATDVSAVANSTATSVNATAGTNTTVDATADTNATADATANSTSTTTTNKGTGSGKKGHHANAKANANANGDTVTTLIIDGIFNKHKREARPVPDLQTGPGVIAKAAKREPSSRKENVVRRGRAAAYHERAF
ncbi:hypothetical protein A1O3_04593 [Capronia epimyces CBS 606.96]|uniref:Uncharacterized protein n=1 Tax=Capronia epimyces CBS 606.96 TaxID=1182542 RepID=W9Y487_9EURO|nr:uncharacterized protein A1O3_04593 [Capronia epimyces CBS 606.96]EXJ87632.1 hypothetical protein A1O3_04593 [Capronia epimyces CBS 606.96]